MCQDRTEIQFRRVNKGRLEITYFNNKKGSELPTRSTFNFNVDGAGQIFCESSLSKRPWKMELYGRSNGTRKRSFKTRRAAFKALFSLCSDMFQTVQKKPCNETSAWMDGANKQWF